MGELSVKIAFFLSVTIRLVPGLLITGVFLLLLPFLARGCTLQQQQRSRFLREYKSNTSYTLEDGHVV
jgi:hypothetical protein